MDAMEVQLRETYASWDTEELVQHLARGGLTETAERVLREELERRNVGSDSIEAASKHQEQLSVQAEEARHRLAPILFRAIAGIIDHLGVLVVIAAVNYPVFLLASRTVSDLVSLISMAGWMAYIFFKDGFNGQSLGKRMLRIQVVDQRNWQPCTLPMSFLRGLVGMLGVIDLVFIFGRRRQRLADLAASTLVVKL